MAELTSTNVYGKLYVSRELQVTPQHLLTDSTERPGVLSLQELQDVGWSGFEIARNGGDFWSLMGSDSQYGLYDDLNSDWILLYTQNGATDIYYNGSVKLATTNTGVDVTGITDGAGHFRSTASTVPTSGTGLEMYWNGSAAYIHPYNRSSAGYVGPTYIRGTSLSLDPGEADSSTFYDGLDISSTGFVFNEGGIDMDFRIESDLYTHSFYMDGATGKIVMGENSSATVYHMINMHADNTDTNILTGVGPTSDDGGILLYNTNAGSGVYTSIDFATNDGYATTYNAARIAWKGYTTSSTAGNYLSFVMYDGGMAEQFRFTRLGDLHAEQDVIAYSTTIGSDIRLKENIETIEEDSLAKIMKLRPVRFDWKKESRKREQKATGFIAQEIEEIFPEVIKEVLPLDNGSGDITAYKHIRYNELIPHITKAMQEQQVIINNQQKEIDDLKEKLVQVLEKIS